jgi:PAS domain S-box-containing protein
MIRILSILMVLIGAAFLSLSFLPARKILGNVSGRLRDKWLVILNLMAFFLLGYLFFDAVLIFSLSFPVELVTGGVFFGGAIFVFIIINLSQNTIAARQKAEEDVRALNESLEQRVAERTRELKRLSDFNRTVLDSIADPISIIDVETFQIVDANQAFIKESNLPEGQIIARTCHEVIYDRSSPCVTPFDSCPLMETLSRNHHARAEHIHWTLQGEKRHVEVLTSPIRDENGKIIQAVHIQRDITARKQSEEDLRDSRELLRVVVEGTSDAVYVKDTAGRYRLFNTAASRVTGKSAEEISGRDDTLLFPADEARAVMQGDLAVMNAGKTMTYEEYATSADGEHLVFLSTKGPLFDEHGNVAGLFGVSRDITGQKKAEAERLEFERNLQHAQKLESLGVLAGGIAHDFNNLLAVIIGNLDLSLMSLPTDSPARTRIERAMQAGMNAANLTRQMLDYAGKGLFVLKELDINEVVRENADLFRTSIARTINLEIVTTPHLSVIYADKGQVQQVIMNLIINAAEAIGADWGVITLRTGLLECDAAYLRSSRLVEKPPAGRFVYLEVSDTGCGMDEETQLRIFEPFFTTKFTGRGLGMASLLGIVREHKGAILVTSEPGRGSTFRVLFPEGNVAEIRSIESNDSAKLSKTPFAFTGKVLIVDDEDYVREMCIAFVRRLGLGAIGAAGGKEAVKIFEEQSDDIALVILDLTMPGMDGVLTFRELRRILPDVRVLVCSGYSKEDVSERFTGARPAGFIQKPFTLHDLQEKISLVVGGRECFTDGSYLPSSENQ